MQPLDGDTSGGTVYLPGYDGTIKVASLFWVLAKLGVMLYLVATALSRQDRYPLNTFEIILRLVLGVLILLKLPAIANTALIVTVIYLLFHHTLGAKRNTKVRVQ